MDHSVITLLFQLRTVLLFGSMMLGAGSMLGILLKGYEKASSPVEGWHGNPLAPRFKTLHKRKGFRVKSNSLFELKDPSGRYMPGTAFLRDISVDGACFESPWVFKPGKDIEARLHSSHEGLLHVTGKIIWSKPKMGTIMYGLKFQSLTPAPR